MSKKGFAWIQIDDHVFWGEEVDWEQTPREEWYTLKWDKDGMITQTPQEIVISTECKHKYICISGADSMESETYECRKCGDQYTIGG